MKPGGSNPQLLKHSLWIVVGIAGVGLSGWFFDFLLLAQVAVAVSGSFVFFKAKTLTRILKERKELQLEAAKHAQATQQALLENAAHLAAVIDVQNELARSNLDPQMLMDLIVSRAAELTRADGGVIEIAESDDMVYRAASGSAAKSIGLRLSSLQSLSGLSVRTGEILICNDAKLDSRVNQEACARIGLRSMVVVPLRHQHKISGVLKVYSGSPSAFNEKQVAILKLMSGFLGAMLDQASEVEARRRSEKASLAAEEAAKAASRMKSEFLANMSHEIRTPINGVIGMTGLLLDTPLSAQQSEFAESIRRSADSLLSLINDILDFSKIEAGKLELEELDFDLREVVHDCHKGLEFSAIEKNIKLVIESCPSFENYLCGDPGRIRQVLVNLIGNAVKFTQKGQVTIKVQAKPIVDGKVGLRFEISDTGVGIPESARGRMFQSFSQADSSTTRKFGGTGLGLSICHKLMELMRGRIGVESHEGVGSLFWFEICLKQGAIIPLTPFKKENAAVISSEKFKGKRVLLAEDNPINQWVTVLLLEKLGIRIDAVANGQEAVEALKTIPYDLVLMDCQMPVMDGYQASRIIRASVSTPYQRIPIVALTANAILGARDECLDAGMNDYLPKPIRMPNVIRMLEKWLTQEPSALLLPSQKDLPVIDIQTFLREYGDLKAHLPKLLQSFISSQASSLAELQKALSDGNCELLKAKAHALKGSVAQIFAKRAAQIAARLEDLGRKGELNGAADLVKELGTELGLLKVELEGMIEKLKKAA